MADPKDLRLLFPDMVALLKAARPKVREVPETTWTPPATEDNPDPEPVVTPARTEVYVDPTDLPEELKVDGNVDLGKQVAWLQATLGQITDSRTRVAVGRSTVTTGVYLAGATFNVPITFDTPALAVPESGWVQIQPAIAWLGRTKAVVKEGSFTTTGCTITVTALNAISLAAANPITYEVVALYSYVPPLTS